MNNYTRSETLTQPKSPAPCPWCGHRPVPYTQRASNLLDIITLLQDVVADLKKAAEEGVS